MFKIKCWCSLSDDEKNIAEKISTRCSNCGKETMIDVDILDTTYQDISTNVLLNKMLHHVVML